MHVQQISIKIPADRTLGFEQSAFIPIFHRWIRDGLIRDRLLIDVADYRHVPDGPGVMLIAHEGHLGLDEGDGRLGLRWSRKRDEPGALDDRLREAWRDALRAAVLIEKEPTSALTFSGSEIELQFQSRLHAPNTQDTFDALVAGIEALCATIFGAPVTVERLSKDARDAFGVRVKSADPATLESQLARL